MDDLISWLRSTIEGDKAVAEALDGETWTAVNTPGDWHIETSQGQTFGGSADYWGELDPNEAALIAAHDPRDTIARCEADLALLDEHSPRERCNGHPSPYLPCNEACEYDCEGCAGVSPCRTVRIFARGYRHRPGYPGETGDDA